MFLLSAACLVVFLTGSRCGHAGKPDPSQDYKNSVFIDADQNYQLNWEATDADITFELIVKTTGYVGIGWSAKRGMDDADIITAWVDDAGKGHIQDRYGIGERKPPMDEKQDVTLLLAKESNGYTVIKFSRKLDTCDTRDRPITKSTMRMIWAYGTTKPADEGSIYHHSKRGAKSMRLIGFEPHVEFTAPEDAQTYEMKVTNFALPAEKTHYECRLLEFPPLDAKHHVIRQEPILTPGNEAYVHHMILYPCSPSMNNITGDEYQSLSSATDCGMFEDCNNPAFSFAIGGEGFTYPDHLGYPIGGPDEPKYARLEIHYDNPQESADIVDSSGIRLIYTPTLRANDVGVIMVGKSTSQMQIIPPEQKDFVTYSFCSNNCTDEGLNMAGVDQIKVFGVFPHTHFAGRGQVTRHIRHGNELAYFVKDDNYDFNYQTTILKEEEVIFKKGDEITVECTYDTMGKDSPVFGGRATTEEMCLSFLYYYPRLPLVMCFSQPTFSTLQSLFAQHHNLGPKFDIENMDGNHFFDYLTHNMSWADAAAPWQNMEKTYHHDQVCTFSSVGTNLKYFPNMPAIVINEPYKPAAGPCEVENSSSKGAMKVTLGHMVILMVFTLSMIMLNAK